MLWDVFNKYMNYNAVLGTILRGARLRATGRGVALGDGSDVCLVILARGAALLPAIRAGRLRMAVGFAILGLGLVRLGLGLTDELGLMLVDLFLVCLMIGISSSRDKFSIDL